MGALANQLFDSVSSASQFGIYKERDREQSLIFDAQLLVNAAVVSLQNAFKDFIMGIIMHDCEYKTEDELREQCDDYYEKREQFIKEIMKFETNPLTFGKMKYAFDSFFYTTTRRGHLQYHYHKTYLISPSEAAESLGTSRQTINKYIKLGMEVIRDTPSHNKIPLHTLDIWKNPVMASRVQFLFAKYQLRRQSNQEKYDDIVAELQELENNHDVEVFQKVLNGEVAVDELENDMDFAKWTYLLEQKEELEEKVKKNE